MGISKIRIGLVLVGAVCMALAAVSTFAAEDVQVQVKPKGNKITRTTTRSVVKPVKSAAAEPAPLSASVPAPPPPPPAAPAPLPVAPAATPVAGASTIRPVADWLRLRFVNEYYGPSIGDPRPFQYDPQENYPGDSQIMLLTASVGYKINKRFQLYWNTRFIWTLAAEDPDSGLRVTDGRLYLADSNLLSIETFKVASRYYIQPAMDHHSRESNRLVSFAWNPSLSYDIPETKVTLGADFLFRYHTYKNGRHAKYPATPTKDMDLVFVPNVSWQFLPTVAAQVAYEMDGKHHKGEDWFTYRLNTVYGTTYLQPGISWDVTPSFNVNPYLTFFTGDKISAKTTNLTIVGVYSIY